MFTGAVDKGDVFAVVLLGGSEVFSAPAAGREYPNTSSG